MSTSANQIMDFFLLLSAPARRALENNGVANSDWHCSLYTWGQPPLMHYII
ncbi:hypothetical protein QNH39_03725 [Neobacillus novalis]|uniref:Uncharacterized protein n=1 Tax=Neobacillus novalis TaxID=220687 RepID=A0AA95SFE9_9BACI|nr:hypothetical protein [Neobacillus novalis]WHY89173.1 hypothetical protein QNH39_03725 [Neobacillus novalis]